MVLFDLFDSWEHKKFCTFYTFQAYYLLGALIDDFFIIIFYESRHKSFLLFRHIKQKLISPAKSLISSEADTVPLEKSKY